jgi:hypothetical protein
MSDVPQLDVDQLVNSAVNEFENGPNAAPVPASVRKFLIGHTAAARDQVLKRIEAGTLSQSELVDGIVRLLWRTDQMQRVDQRPTGDLVTEPPPRPLATHYMLIAMSKDCPVFPYCVDANRCSH